jgi:methyltransferase (TIGR00027 family)
LEQRQAKEVSSSSKEEVDMSEITNQNLSDVEKTLLITLYIRAMESQRTDALVKDERAEALVRRLDQESLQKTAALTEDMGRAVVILKGREFDRFAQDFMARHPDAVVVHIGCGLDTRFERVAECNDRVEWYDLDLPDVIELRRRLVGGEGTRHHFLACSVLESAWLDTVSAHHQRPFLFLAEGVFMYFTEAQVKSLVLTLRDRFPGAELVFDAFAPFLYRAHNRKVTRTGIGAHLHWSLKRPQDLERWSGVSGTGVGIRLLDERFPFQYPEPRMRRSLMVLLIPFLAKAFGVFQYQL